MTRGEVELGGIVVVGVYEYMDALLARLFAPLVGYAVAAYEGDGVMVVHLCEGGGGLAGVVDVVFSDDA